MPTIAYPADLRDALLSWLERAVPDVATPGSYEVRRFQVWLPAGANISSLVDRFRVSASPTAVARSLELQEWAAFERLVDAARLPVRLNTLVTIGWMTTTVDSALVAKRFLDAQLAARNADEVSSGVYMQVFDRQYESLVRLLNGAPFRVTDSSYIVGVELIGDDGFGLVGPMSLSTNLTLSNVDYEEVSDALQSDFQSHPHLHLFAQKSVVRIDYAHEELVCVGKHDGYAPRHAEVEAIRRSVVAALVLNGLRTLAVIAHRTRIEEAFVVGGNSQQIDPERAQYYEISTVKLRPGDVPALEAARRAAREIAENGDKRFRLGLRYFLASARRRDVEDRLIDLVVACEALFIDGKGSEIAHKLALRMATFLEPDTKARYATFRVIKKVYDLRSGLVHGSSAPPDLYEQVEGLHDLVRRSILGLARIDPRGVPGDEAWTRLVLGESLAR